MIAVRWILRGDAPLAQHQLAGLQPASETAIHGGRCSRATWGTFTRAVRIGAGAVNAGDSSHRHNKSRESTIVASTNSQSPSARDDSKQSVESQTASEMCIAVSTVSRFTYRHASRGSEPHAVRSSPGSGSRGCASCISLHALPQAQWTHVGTNPTDIVAAQPSAGTTPAGSISHHCPRMD